MTVACRPTSVTNNGLDVNKRRTYDSAASQVGLDVLRRKGTVLKCYANMAETVTFSEIGMSMAVMEAGYNIDSLMLRYQARDLCPTAHSFPQALRSPTSCNCIH